MGLTISVWYSLLHWSSPFDFRCYTPITHKLLPPLRVNGCMGIVISSQIFDSSSKILCRYLSRFRTVMPVISISMPNFCSLTIHGLPLASSCLSNSLALCSGHLPLKLSLISHLYRQTPVVDADQVILTILQLQGIRIKLGINAPRIEQKLICRDGKQRLGILLTPSRLKSSRFGWLW